MNCGKLLSVDVKKRLEAPLCEECRLSWEREKTESCSRCGLDMKLCTCMPKALERAECSALLKLVSYRAHGDMAISRFFYSIKHSYNRAGFDFLAEQMKFLLIPEMRARGLMPRDCVISYLPRSAKNKNKDGFDQGREFARALSRITGICCESCFSRRIFVNEQKKLNSFERNLNMNSAFKLKIKSQRIENKTVILVDDIVTTGSGMAAATRLLFSGGAYEVIGLCVGYTKKHKK